MRIGLVGVGHLGKIHLKCIKMIPEYEFVGFYDENKEFCEKVSQEFGVKAFASYDELLDSVDVVDIVTPTIAHFTCAKKALEANKHVFIEKPITQTLEEALALEKLANERNLKVQVGHVERFNPAFLAVEKYFSNPLFVETHRLAEFNPRGTDVPVVLDLMIHDIDIVLHVVKSEVKDVKANGVAVISDTPDIANARIEFENGCVANLTASRLSMKNMRKSRFFQPNAYISVDFLEKTSEIIDVKAPDPNDNNPFAMILEIEGKEAREIGFHRPEIQPINSIQTELATFREAILNNTRPIVDLSDGKKALEVALMIMEKMAFGKAVL